MAYLYEGSLLLLLSPGFSKAYYAHTTITHAWERSRSRRHSEEEGTVLCSVCIPQFALAPPLPLSSLFHLREAGRNNIEALKLPPINNEERTKQEERRALPHKTKTRPPPFFHSSSSPFPLTSWKGEDSSSSPLLLPLSLSFLRVLIASVFMWGGEGGGAMDDLPSILHSLPPRFHCRCRTSISSFFLLSSFSLSPSLVEKGLFPGCVPCGGGKK